MGNEISRRGGDSQEDGDEDIQEMDDERLELMYATYLNRLTGQRLQQQQRKKKQKRKVYSIEKDESNEEYMVCTNNIYEAKIHSSIYKKQSTHYSDFHRKLNYLNNKNTYKRFQQNSNTSYHHLDLPPTFNYHSKVMENMIPNQRTKIDEIDNSIYNIMFSQDGTQLLITTQENLYTYREVEGEYKRGNVLYPRNITWTITDSDLSSSGRFLIHCSLNPFISIFDIQHGKYTNFYNFNDGEEQDESNWDHLRFFSCKYSQDDTKIIASSGKQSNKKAEIKMFDVNRERIQDSIQAHNDDINSIAFLNKSNPYVFVSGSDDRTVKIWDTRALGSNGKCAGELLGHVAGITHVDSRQDDYYIASNGKDSCVKLWDIRKKVDSSTGKPRSNYSFDYRMGALSDKDIQKIRNLKQEQNYDNSVMSYRGHKVGKTLMRCHFSPLGPTDRRYIYTASYCGKVFLYDILSSQSTPIDDFQAEKNSYTAAILNDMEGSVVRDAAWHPHKMEIITTNLRGQLFKWYNHHLHFQEIDDIVKENQAIENDTETQDNNRQSQFDRFDYDYNQGYYDDDEDDDEEHVIHNEDDEEEEEEDEEDEEDEDEKDLDIEDSQNSKDKDDEDEDDQDHTSEEENKLDVEQESSEQQYNLIQDDSEQQQSQSQQSQSVSQSQEDMEDSQSFSKSNSQSDHNNKK